MGDDKEFVNSENVENEDENQTDETENEVKYRRRLELEKMMREWSEKQVQTLFVQNKELKAQIVQLEDQIASLQKQKERAEVRVEPAKPLPVFDSSVFQRTTEESQKNIQKIIKETNDSILETNRQIMKRRQASMDYQSFLRRNPGASNISFEDWERGNYVIVTDGRY